MSERKDYWKKRAKTRSVEHVCQRCGESMSVEYDTGHVLCSFCRWVMSEKAKTRRVSHKVADASEK